MLNKLELVARPEEVQDAFMDKALVCRTSQELPPKTLAAPAQLANRVRSQGTHLYFIKIAKGRGPVKIGRANDPLVRLATLQVASPYQLKLLGTLEDCGEYEMAFHLHLGVHRMRGEWFAWSKEVERVVKLALEGGDWRAEIAERARDFSDPDGWWVGSPLYAGNPNYPQFQVNADDRG